MLPLSILAQNTARFSIDNAWASWYNSTSILHLHLKSELMVSFMLYISSIIYLAFRMAECLTYLNQSKERMKRNQEEEPQGTKTINKIFILCSVHAYYYWQKN